MLGLVWAQEECQEPVPCQVCLDQVRARQVQVLECQGLEAKGPQVVDKASK